MTTFTLQSISPDKLNSATKYPSIPTYHTLQNNGGLTEPAIEFTGPVVATEKVDGCNARVIFLPDGSYVLGSREDLLHASGDYLTNPAHGLVEALQPWAQDWAAHPPRTDAIQVVYVELYGGRNLTPASKNYTGTRAVGYRLFDVALIHDYDQIATDWTVEKIAAWRDRGGQHFLPEAALTAFSDESGIELTPRLCVVDGAELPRDIVETHNWLARHSAATRVALDEGAQGRSEGIVLRTLYRSTIAKLRFQNYNRTRKLAEQATRRG